MPFKSSESRLPPMLPSLGALRAHRYPSSLVLVRTNGTERCSNISATMSWTQMTGSLITKVCVKQKSVRMILEERLAARFTRTEPSSSSLMKASDFDCPQPYSRQSPIRLLETTQPPRCSPTLTLLQSRMAQRYWTARDNQRVPPNSMPAFQIGLL